MLIEQPLLTEPLKNFVNAGPWWPPEPSLGLRHWRAAGAARPWKPLQIRATVGIDDAKITSVSFDPAPVRVAARAGKSND